MRLVLLLDLLTDAKWRPSAVKCVFTFQVFFSLPLDKVPEVIQRLHLKKKKKKKNTKDISSHKNYGHKFNMQILFADFQNYYLYFFERFVTFHISHGYGNSHMQSTKFMGTAFVKVLYSRYAT